MNDFAFYFDLGWQHIISTDALDHQLFILALSAIYLANDWKKVLILVTAFTVGHSLTLLLSTYNIITVSSAWVEFLIPLTIVITAALNFLSSKIDRGQHRLQYVLAAGFGLIHGLGFANTIRFMLADAQNVTVPLLGFNLGLEAGQVLVVACILLLGYVVVNRLKLPRTWWVWSLSAVALVVSAVICTQRFPYN